MAWILREQPSNLMRPILIRAVVFIAVVVLIVEVAPNVVEVPAGVALVVSVAEHVVINKSTMLKNLIRKVQYL